MTESDVEEKSFAKEEKWLRRRAWILLGVGVALIPLIYLLMVKVLLPRFWIEEDVDAAGAEVSMLVLEQSMTVVRDDRQ